MIFADMPTHEAEGAILVHSLRAGEITFKKGRVLSASDIAALASAQVARVTAVRLEASDVPEDEAAAALAAALAGSNTRLAAPFTGRANLFAEADGVLIYDPARLDAINLIDEALTVAILAPYETVTARQMIGTVKVIPFAAPRVSLDAAVALAAEDTALVSVAPFTPQKVGLVATTLASLKDSTLNKTRTILDARLSAMGSHITHEIRPPHTESDIAAAVSSLIKEGCSPVLVIGASAITDRRDVVPAGIVASGGAIDHFGMPVDPGNLMLLAHHGTVPVLGLPGCARSPALNGFDWVLARLLANVPVTRGDIMRMGAGGLLKEISTRPQPREGKPSPKPSAPRVAAIVLAAGKSSRMGALNKLTAEVEGRAMVARAVEAAHASGAAPVIVVTGHESELVRAALKDGPVRFTHNPDYADGLSTSLRTGAKALPEGLDAVLVCLGDMPDISSDHITRLIAAFDPDEGRTICVPTFAGKRGNPVLWGAAYFAELQTLKGDTGAKHLIGEHADAVCEVPMPDDASLRDIDTPDELAARLGK
ncbi:MAG: molybdopterin-binding/glycosyltransferase family 2 protein [Parvibaculum sp.]|nr:molybdopterin-binding/glycosyltransferase family 2 protein [Parvibaculum sp.]